MKRMLMSCALPLALSACSTMTDLPSGYALGANPAEGLAIVSLTLSGKELSRVSSFEYHVRETAAADAEPVNREPRFGSMRQFARWVQDKGMHGAAAETKVVVKGHSLAEPLDVVESGRTLGRVAVLRLPAGEYEFYDWKMVASDVHGGNEFSPKHVAPLRFRVEAGRATYLGDVDLHLTEQDTYDVAVEDKAQRDLALAARKLPSIAAADILRHPLTAARQ